MKRKLNTREKWLLAVAPAVLILAIHAFGVYRPRQQSIVEAERRLAQARQDVVSPTLVRTRQAEVDQLEALLTRWQKSGGQSATDEPATTAVAAKRVTAGEPASLAAVGRAFRDQGLFVVSTTRLAGDGGVDAGDVRETIRQLGCAATSSVWRLELVGEFAAVRDGLRALEQLDCLAVPVGISMDPLDGGGHRWQVWLWM